MTNLDSILKSRDIIWLTKVHIVKAMIFPVVTYGCKNWIIKGLSTKELMLLTVVLEKTLESPLDCKAQECEHQAVGIMEVIPESICHLKPGSSTLSHQLNG